MTNQKQEWEKGYLQTKFVREGGSCFECCDYEEMSSDMFFFISQAINQAREEERDRIMAYNQAISDLSTNIKE